MIVIINNSIRGVVSNEETLWSYLEKKLDNSVGISFDSLKEPLEKKLQELQPSLIIQNANLGKLSNYKTISYVLDPMIEIQKLFEPFWVRMRTKIRGRETFDDKIKKQFDSFNGSIKVTNSNFMAHLYKKGGDFKVIPLGVDLEIFKPLDKTEMRKKHNLPLDKKINIFVGSTHPIKGFEKIKKMIQNDPDVFWILVLKDIKLDSGHNFVTFHKLSQETLCELYNCADLFVARSLVESAGLAALEAMICDVPVDVTPTGVFWDWKPDMNNPRKEALKQGFDKNTWIRNWEELVTDCIKS